MRIALSSINGFIFIFFAFILFKIVQLFYMAYGSVENDAIAGFIMRLQMLNVEIVAMVLAFFCVTHLWSTIALAKNKHNVFLVILNYTALIFFVLIAVVGIVKIFTDEQTSVAGYMAVVVMMLMSACYFFTGRMLKKFRG